MPPLPNIPQAGRGSLYEPALTGVTGLRLRFEPPAHKGQYLSFWTAEGWSEVFAMPIGVCSFHFRRKMRHPSLYRENIVIGIGNTEIHRRFELKLAAGIYIVEKESVISPNSGVRLVFGLPLSSMGVGLSSACCLCLQTWALLGTRRRELLRVERNLSAQKTPLGHWLQSSVLSSPFFSNTGRQHETCSQ
jgi:hypothetical protein